MHVECFNVPTPTGSLHRSAIVLTCYATLRANLNVE